RIAALSSKVQADAEQLANALSGQIESSVLQLVESSQAEAARTAATLGSLEAKVVAAAEKSSAETAAIAQRLTNQIESHARQLGEQIQKEAAGSAALLEEKFLALLQSGKADIETLERKLDARVNELTETARSESAKTAALFESRISALSEKTQSDTQA